MSRSSILSLDISVPLTQRPLSYLGAAGRARGRATAVPWWRCPKSPEAGGPWGTLRDPTLLGGTLGIPFSWWDGCDGGCVSGCPLAACRCHR